jgi:hypothetical protein
MLPLSVIHMHTPALYCPVYYLSPFGGLQFLRLLQQLVLEPAKRGKEFTKIYESRSYGFAYWMAEQA